MGKLNNQQIDKLAESGKISKKTANDERKKKLSKRNSKSIRYMKTKDNKWVVPTLYFRGSHGSKQSKKMQEFVTAFNKLVEEHGVTKS